MNLVYEIKYALENGFTNVERLIEKDGSIAYNGSFGYFVVTDEQANEIDALIAQYQPAITSPKLERLLESLAKSESKVEKIEATILRHHKQLKKKADALIALGYDIDYSNVNFDCRLSKDFSEQIAHIEKMKWDENNDHKSVEHYWELCDLMSKLRDINGSHNKLADAKKVVDNWHVKIVAEQARTDFAASAPKVIVDFVNEWGELAFNWYMANLNYPDETRVKRMVENEKQIKIIQLTSNVISVVGTITDARGLSIGEKGDLIGIIEGEKGKARVETISAGGYNIQKFHYRTIVNKI